MKNKEIADFIRALVKVTPKTPRRFVKLFKAIGKVVNK